MESIEEKKAERSKLILNYVLTSPQFVFRKNVVMPSDTNGELIPGVTAEVFFPTKILKGVMKMANEIRTARAFVEDMLTDGKTAEEILIVAKNTRWSSKIEEIKEVLKSFSDFLKKRFTTIN